jgi:hypothetical protein
MTNIIERDRKAEENGEQRGKHSFFSCPECGGILWQATEKERKNPTH